MDLTMNRSRTTRAKRLVEDAIDDNPIENTSQPISSLRKTRSRRHKTGLNEDEPSSRRTHVTFTQLKLDVRLIIYELSAIPSKYPDSVPFPTWSPVESSMFLLVSHLGDLVALQAMKSFHRIAVYTQDMTPEHDAHDKAMAFLTFAARSRCLGSEFTTNLAHGGHLKSLIWAHQQGCLIEKENCTESAASGGHVHVIRWLRTELGCDWTPKLCSLAAMNGHLTLLQWLKQENCPWSENMYSAAAKKGHVHVLEWLHQEVADVPIDETLCATAAENDQIQVLQWMREQRISLDYVFKYAVRAGCTHTILSLLSSGYSWDPDTFVVAVEKGDVELLRWLKRRGCPWDEEAFCTASLAGRLDIMKWLRRNGCPWDARTFAAAARTNDMAILRWLHRVKCPSDERTMQAAAQSADLTTLMWVHRMKYPWDIRTGIAAAEHCSMYTLMWLRDVGCPWDDARCKEAAKRNPNTQAREWIQMNGYTYFEDESA